MGAYRHRRNSSTGVAPGNGVLWPGEIAINTADGKLFYGNPDRTTGTLALGTGSAPNSVTATADFGVYDGLLELTLPCPWAVTGNVYEARVSAGLSGDHTELDVLLEQLAAVVTSVTTGIGFMAAVLAPNGAQGRYLLTITG